MTRTQRRRKHSFSAGTTLVPARLGSLIDSPGSRAERTLAKRWERFLQPNSAPAWASTGGNDLKSCSRFGSIPGIYARSEVSRNAAKSRGVLPPARHARKTLENVVFCTCFGGFTLRFGSVLGFDGVYCPC